MHGYGNRLAGYPVSRKAGFWTFGSTLKYLLKFLTSAQIPYLVNFLFNKYDVLVMAKQSAIKE
jgi:hypothetical protein